MPTHRERRASCFFLKKGTIEVVAVASAVVVCVAVAVVAPAVVAVAEQQPHTPVGEL